MVRSLILSLLALVLIVPAAAQTTTVAIDVAEDATAANSQPKIGRTRAGTAYLTFVKQAGGFSQVFVASSPDGRQWKTVQMTRGSGDSRYSTLAVGPDDHVHLAWTQYTEPVGKVYYSQFDGRRWSVPVRVSPGQAYAGIPAIAIDAQGNPHIVWYGIRAQAPAIHTRHGSIYEILYSHVSGGRWTAAEVISPGIPDSINPALAIDGTGTLHSAWYQFDLRVYQARYTQRTTTADWERPRQVSSGNDDAAAVALAAGTDGSVYLVWERHETEGSRIYFAERHRNWSAQQLISQAGRNALNPTITADARGRIYIGWESDDQIFLRRREGQWLNVERLTSAGQNVRPILASAGSTVDLMWTQHVGRQRQLQFVTLIGGPISPAATGRRPWGIIVLVLILLAILWQIARAQRLTRDA